MITIAYTESGSLLLTGHGAAQIVAPHDAPALASAIRRIIARPVSQTCPPTPTQLGQRLAQMRRRRQREI